MRRTTSRCSATAQGSANFLVRLLAAQTTVLTQRLADTDLKARHLTSGVALGAGAGRQASIAGSDLPQNTAARLRRHDRSREVPTMAARNPIVPCRRQWRGVQQRKPALVALTAVVVVAALGYGAYWSLVLRHQESTDNAYVQAPMVQITPQWRAPCSALLVDDTDIVKVGQPLVAPGSGRCPTDARSAPNRSFAQTVREVRTLYANNGALDATIKLREAEVARMQSEVARANDDVARRQPLTATGAVAGEEMQSRRDPRCPPPTAHWPVPARRWPRAQSRRPATVRSPKAPASTSTPTCSAPPPRARGLARRAAQRAAGTGGWPGGAAHACRWASASAPGTPLMSVIPLDQVWVEANFKEVQLRDMRIGQPGRR